jgi:hypothetical protein
MVESPDWNPEEPLGKNFPPMKNDLILRAARGVSHKNLFSPQRVHVIIKAKKPSVRQSG